MIHKYDSYHYVMVHHDSSVTNQEEQFLKFKPTTNLQKAKNDHVFNSQNTWHDIFDFIDVHMMPLKFQNSSNYKNKSIKIQIAFCE